MGLFISQFTIHDMWLLFYWPANCYFLSSRKTVINIVQIYGKGVEESHEFPVGSAMSILRLLFLCSVIEHALFARGYLIYRNNGDSSFIRNVGLPRSP